MENNVDSKMTNSPRLEAFVAEFSARTEYPQFGIEGCDPGFVYVLNDLPGQTITTIEFDIDIIGPQDAFSKHVKSDRLIGPGNYLPIRLPVTQLDRLGQLRNFKFSANPGEFAAVEQKVGETGKTYSWHVIWAHNSLRNQ